jgi:hypothetical protein
MRLLPRPGRAKGTTTARAEDRKRRRPEAHRQPAVVDKPETHRAAHLLSQDNHADWSCHISADVSRFDRRSSAVNWFRQPGVDISTSLRGNQEPRCNRCGNEKRCHQQPDKSSAESPGLGGLVDR